MIKIENTDVVGFEHAIRGMRNPMNSWDKSDSGYCGGNEHIGCVNCACIDDKTKKEKLIDTDLNYGYGVKPCGKKDFDNKFCVGDNDLDLMKRLAKAGTDHRKFMRMITVYLDITAPLYWWKEFDTYKVGTVANSCSTMHKIHDKEFDLDDFSYEHLTNDSTNTLIALIQILEANRKIFLALEGKEAKEHWWQIIQLLPSSYNQRRTVMLNYEVLANMYHSRKHHKLDEWREFCKWVEKLPYSELIIGEKE